MDYGRVKKFWDDRATLYGKIPFESIGNLEQDPTLVDLKVKLETEKISHWLGSLKGQNILDLGSGIGQWSFRFALWGAERIVAVDYSSKLTSIAKKEAKRRKLGGVEFLVSPAESFFAERKFDLIYISGLLIYLSDTQIENLLGNIKRMCKAGGRVLVRDGTGLSGRYEISNVYSEHLDDNYSAIYRTRDEYLSIFAEHGFGLLADEDMFDDGSPLNKHAETRLRVYLFSSTDSKSVKG